MMPALTDMIPKSKHDHDAARAAIALGYPAVEPILGDLLEWLQDMNWPVAGTLEPFLASIGLPLVPHIRRIFDTDDQMWKIWVMSRIVAKSPDLMAVFLPDIERFAFHPTPGERID